MPNPAVPTKLGRLPSRPIDEADALIVLHPADDVAIAKQPLLPGTRIRRPGGAELIAGQLIPSGHKLAISALRRGAPVRRYGQIIGLAVRPISAGDLVHEHNLAVGDFRRDCAIGADYRPVEMVRERDRRTFRGFRRADGRVGTRRRLSDQRGLWRSPRLSPSAGSPADVGGRRRPSERRRLRDPEPGLRGESA